MSNTISFEPVHFSDVLHVVNPFGDVGVVTLWTKVAAALEFLTRLQIDLDPHTSRIAVIGNLYGDGLAQMVVNLLWNPQISSIVIFGQDLSGSATELVNLLTRGTTRTLRFGQERLQVIDTVRYLDACLPTELLTGSFHIARFGKMSASETKDGVQAFFTSLAPQVPPTRGRLEAMLPVYKPNYYPSEPRAHTIVRRRPLDAWEEIVCQIIRFGVPSVASSTKKRLELQNLKVVITEPCMEDDLQLRRYGFRLADLQQYQSAILDAELPEDISYTYGNRLRSYWKDGAGHPLDLLDLAAQKLRDSPTSRGAYISLWDSNHDLVDAEGKSKPCLVSLFFRIFENSLTLTATFRSHNTMTAWLKNAYGLMAIQKFVCNSAGVAPCGAITVISHSISIDPTNPEKLDLAQQIMQAKKDDLELNRDTGKRELREDPNGYFVFSIDESSKEILADHKFGGETLTRYKGRTASDIEKQIARDSAISLISHALYVGRELAIQEAKLGSSRSDERP